MTAAAYIKVIDAGGERDLGGDLATTLVPNRSIHIGGNLLMIIQEEETYLKLYEISGGVYSSSSIEIFE